MRKLPSTLLAGAVVYVVVAACSGAGGGNGADDAGLVDVFFDALRDVVSPVSDARADGDASCTCSSTPLVAVEPCPATVNGWTMNGGNGRIVVHAFPGKTAVELARVVVLLSEPTTTDPTFSFGRIDGGAAYFTTTATPIIRDGEVIASCDQLSDTATFILPQ